MAHVAALERCQVALKLPVSDIDMIVAPLLAFQLEEFIGDWAEGRANHGVGLEVVEGLAERLGPGLHASDSHGFRPALVKVVQVQLAGIELSSDARGEVGGERQVRVADARRRAVLDVARLADAEHLGAVVIAVGDERGHPGEAGTRAGERETHLKALKAIHRGEGDRGERFGVGNDPPE